MGVIEHLRTGHMAKTTVEQVIEIAWGTCGHGFVNYITYRRSSQNKNTSYAIVRIVRLLEKKLHGGLRIANAGRGMTT